MAEYKYYPSAQFQTMLERRHHDDSFLGETLLLTQAADIDVADFMREDILNGNTHTVSSAYRRIKDDSRLKTQLFNGTRSEGAGLFHNVIEDHTMYPCVPIKDDHSDGAGYHEMASDDPRRRDTERALKAMNMRLEDIGPAVLEPEDIPAIGTQGFKVYKDVYESTPELQEEFATLEDYRNDLVEDLGKQRKDIKDISDVTVSIFALGSTLDETNVIALYHTMAHIYPQITYNGAQAKPIKNFPPTNYMMEFQSGDFIAACGWKSWSHIIRKGIVSNKFDIPGEEVRWKKAKGTHDFFWEKDVLKNHTDGDPIHQILQNNEQEVPGWDDVPLFEDQETPPPTKGMLQVQVQLQPLPDGTHVYGEIRVWGYGTFHAITDNDNQQRYLLATIADGREGYEGDGETEIVSPTNITVDDGATYIGKAEFTDDGNGGFYEFSFAQDGNDEDYFTIDQQGRINAKAPLSYAVKDTYYFRVSIETRNIANQPVFNYTEYKVTVANTNNLPAPPFTEDPFENKNTRDKGFTLILFPLEMKAAKEVPFFRRERFLREAVVLGIYSTKKVKIKWYEKGWFKIALFVIAVFLSWVTSGASLKLYAIITAVKTVVINMIIAYAIGLLINGMIDSPLLAAIITVIMIAYGAPGTFNIANLNLGDMASLGMKAGEAYASKYLNNKMEDIKFEMEQFAKEMGELTSEIEEMFEQFGEHARQDAAGFIRFIVSLAQVETPEAFDERTLNVDTAIIDTVDDSLNVDTGTKVW